MRRYLIAMLALVATCSWGAPPEIGEPALPMTRMEFLDGTPVRFTAFKGKPVIIYMGADWCPPCVMTARPTVESIARRYGDRVHIIFVNADDNNVRAARLAEERSSSIRNVLPKLKICPPGKCPMGTRDLGQFGRVYRYPSAVVLDGNGVVRANVQNANAILTRLESELKEVLAQGPSPGIATKPANPVAIASSMEQRAESLVGTWEVEVAGGGRLRQLVISAVKARTEESTSLEARYGWLGEKLSPIRATVQEGDTLWLHLVTPANSLVTAEFKDGAPMAGTFHATSGKLSPVKLRRVGG